ncbi:MAG: Nramp family divalent metal transporter [Bacteroidia bacterium]|nr:Nramp family divalent metal transporter [Bacteroidia bacterium]
MVKKEKKKSRRGSIWKSIGPGLITGASDDDPSGIATYSQAGAAFGYKLLWTSIITYPMMATIQEMCARIGMVTGEGLSGTVKRHYPQWVLYIVVLFSFPAIVLNIGADLAGMGAVASMLYPDISGHEFSLAFTVLIMTSIIFLSYRKLATILKWLCMVLFCYCIVPFLGDINWKDVLKNTFLPSFEASEAYLLALIGILGTTISPYLFFWQASVEVEEMQSKKLIVDKHLIDEMRFDVRFGILFSNLVFFFIVLTSGAVLFPAGIHTINTVDEAAIALKPLSGSYAYHLFAIGVIGTGMLAIPVLAGSLSYILAETFNWTEGLDKKFHEAKAFYGVIIVSLIIAFLIQFLDISPVRALIVSAIAYGVTSPVLIAIILHICNNKKVMGSHVNRKKSNFIGIITLLFMLSAIAAFLFILFRKESFSAL